MLRKTPKVRNIIVNTEKKAANSKEKEFKHGVLLDSLVANTILETTQVEDTFKDLMIDFFDAWEEALQNIFISKYSKKIAKEKSIQVITYLEGAIILMQLKSNSKYLEDAVQRCLKLY